MGGGHALKVFSTTRGATGTERPERKRNQWVAMSDVPEDGQEVFGEQGEKKNQN